jgi:two-component system, cell cycle response regulator
MKPRVLLVEDNATQAKLVVHYLNGRGFDVSWVSDGAAGIHAALASPPDCVLLDAQLPDIDGFSVCRMLRSREDTRGLPIIMLTSRSAVEDRIRGLEAGASDYLPKPFDPGELEARIRSTVRAQEISREVAEKNRHLESLLSKFQALATTDDLTGLSNRRMFFEELEREIARFVRYGSPVALLLVDVDRFKAVNDDYGHQAGDSVLKTLGALLAETFRRTDLAARYGGEEFAVLLPETGLDQAVDVAERLRRRVEATAFPSPAGELAVTISVGAAVAGDGARDAESLVRAADEALYRAKSGGRNRVEGAG